MAEPTDSQKAVSLVFPGFKLGLDDPKQAERLAEIGVGGFCLYAGEAGEIAALTARLQAKAPRPLLFCADYEDGLAQHCAGGTALPSAMALGASGSEELAFEKGAITAREAAAIGVRWVLAPVCDLATCAGNPIVNVRAFSDDPRLASRLARAYLRGVRSEGCLSCLKHFPGHGETRQDSHLELPEVGASRSTLESRELAPFRALASDADSVMTGHLVVPALEPDRGVPYSLSSDVDKTLRRDLGFGGLVSTDALNMHAVSDRFVELDAARRALLGGSDVLLVPVDPRALAKELSAAVEADAALRGAAQRSFARLAAARERLSKPAADLSVVGCAEHGEAARRMARAALTWTRGPQPALPKSVLYFEPEAERPDEWLGETFVESLRRQGFAVRPYEGGPAGEALIVGCFLAPHAYTGRIEYEPQEKERVARALAAGPRPLIVSFGSPFVFGAFDAPGLCAFSRIDACQEAAAQALAGAIPAPGRMPVRLDR